MPRFAPIGRHLHSRKCHLPARLQSHQPQVTGAQNDGSAHEPYQSEVSFGQDRALVTWDRIIFPDGSSIVISAPGADAQGFGGLSDRTDHHWDRVFIAAGLATILGIGAELGADGDGDIERAVRRGTTDTINQAGQRVVERNLGIQPTIRVRPGWPVRVVVTRDLILRPHS